MNPRIPWEHSLGNTVLGYNAVWSVEKSTDVSEEHITSIFMVEEAELCLPPTFTPVSF
jgi:hypothetical protein